MKNALSLVDQLKHARRVSVPLVAINTPDSFATLSNIATKLPNGKPIPMVFWDIARGTQPVVSNPDSMAIAMRIDYPCIACKGSGQIMVDGNAKTCPQCKGTGIAKDKTQQPMTAGKPEAFILAIQERLPSGCMAFLLNGEEFIQDGGRWINPVVRQALQNLRDQFKRDRRILVLLQPNLTLPSLLSNDVVVLDEPLPDADALEQIVREQDLAASQCTVCNGTGASEGAKCKDCQGTGINPKRPLTQDAVVQRAVEAVAGLSAFSAEQSVAMSLRKTGIDLEHLWDKKRSQVEQTRGLNVYSGGETYDDIGGLANIKSYLRAILGGRRPPKAIIWLDELEKSGLGAAKTDSSGVSGDQLGSILSYMEDHRCLGVLLLGVPGAGKSAIAKATGAEFDRVTIRIDLGDMMDKFVGSSQASIRQALKVVTAVGSDNVLWIATSNSVEGLDTALRSRFSRTFFFDLPSREEKDKIWDVWLKRYPEVERQQIDDTGWVGRNIRQAIEDAWQTSNSLEDVSQWVIPVAELERETIAKLRAEADGRYLCAANPGVYHAPSESMQGNRFEDLTKRSIEV